MKKYFSEHERRKWEGRMRMDLKEICRGVWNGFSWVKTGTDGRLF
jgi:hypothetical protein